MSMRQILLVEDSKMFGRLAKSRIEKTFDIPVYWTKTLAETEKLLAMAKGNFSMALLDFSLPDAPHGEVIDRVIAEGITTFVFTADLTEEVRNLVWSKKVADYIIAAMLEDSEPIYVTSSTGICVPIVESLEAMMKLADEHLYKAKNGGRNRVEF